MGKINILLVDDEADFLELMAVRIREWGYDLVKAKNGEEALAAVENRPPDIVILDYMLPDMDGLSVLKKLRKVNAKLPVIMFTAYPETKTIEGSQKLGIAAFIPKVSEYTDTLASLKSALEMLARKIEDKD